MMEKIVPGKFIVIEGCDACGKATQSKLLRERLSSSRLSSPSSLDRKTEPLLLSFPRYDTLLGKAIHRHLKGYTMLTEELTRDSSDMEVDGTSYHRRAPEDALVFQSMMAADKFNAADAIELQLAAGGHVVADRWWQSGLTYGTSDGVDPQWTLDTYACLPLADLNILIDVPTEVTIARRPVARDRYEQSKQKREDVRRRYIDMWRQCIDIYPSKWVVVDGMMSVEQVEAKIWSHVVALLDDKVEAP